MRIRTTRGVRAALLAAVTAFVALGATAIANPVTGGKTKLALDPDTAEAFADMSIGIEPTGAAKFSQGFFKFPVKGGDLEDTGTGEIEHKGGLAFFTEGGPGVKFTQFVVKVGASKAKVFAKSEHAAVRLLDIDLGDQSKRAFDFKIKDADTTLAKEGAQVLSETFDFPFRKGIDMGQTTIKVNVGS